MTAPDSITPRTRASAHLCVRGPGDDLAAASMRKSTESLLACGVAELTVDLSSLDDAYPTFVRTLAALTATARDRSCELFLIGVNSPAVLAALDEAPLDELFAVYEAACRHDTTPTAAVAPRPGRNARSAWVPAQAQTTRPASARSPVASAASKGAAVDATGPPRHARGDDDIDSVTIDEGAEMTGADNTKATHPVDRDRLVELHVLAAHGDPTAAAHAAEWMAADPVARRMWDSVSRTCDELGASTA